MWGYMHLKCVPPLQSRYLGPSEHIAVETDPALWKVEASLQEDVPLERTGIVWGGGGGNAHRWRVLFTTCSQVIMEKNTQGINKEQTFSFFPKSDILALWILMTNYKNDLMSLCSFLFLTQNKQLWFRQFFEQPPELLQPLLVALQRSLRHRETRTLRVRTLI